MCASAVARLAERHEITLLCRDGDGGAPADRLDVRLGDSLAGAAGRAGRAGAWLLRLRERVGVAAETQAALAAHRGTRRERVRSSQVRWRPHGTDPQVRR